MKEQRVYRGDIHIYSGSTRTGEFPDKFQLRVPLHYMSAGYGEAMVYIDTSDINNVIDALTDWRDKVDHEQAVESGDMNVAVS